MVDVVNCVVNENLTSHLSGQVITATDSDYKLYDYSEGLSEK